MERPSPIAGYTDEGQLVAIGFMETAATVAPLPSE